MFYWDIAAIILLVCSLILYGLIVARSSRKRGRIRTAYLGYAVCAMVVGLFQLHLHADGPAIFMMFNVFLFPIAIAAMLAIANTVGTRSATLQILGGSTLALGILQILTFMGIVGTYMNVIARSYVVLVLIACIYRRREWWPRRENIEA